MTEPTTPVAPRKKRLVALAAGAVMLVAAAGGGAWVYVVRNADAVKKAGQLEAGGDMRGAMFEWRNAVAKDPKNAGHHLRLAGVLMHLYDTYAAEKELRLALALGADRWAVLPMLGRVFVAQSRWRSLLAELPRTGAALGAAPEVAVQLQMLRGTAQIAVGDLDAASATLAAAETLAPGSADTLLLAGRVALARGDVPGAEAKIDAALQAAPGRIDALLVKLQLAAARGDTPEALRLADRAVASAPFEPGPRMDRANQFMASGQDAKARADVDFVLSRFPNLPGANYLDAMLLARAGAYKDASTAFTRLAPVIDQFPRALYVQALVSANLGNNETAMELARRYNARIPGDPDGVRLLARTQLLAKRPDLVAPMLERAIAAGQSDAVTLDLLGSAYAAMGETAAAMRVRKRAAELAPSDAGILAHLGQLQLSQGDAGAAATLERSARLAPEQPPAARAEVDDTMIEAALAARELDRAQSLVDRLRTQDGETERVGLLAGTVLLARNDNEGARRAFAATLKAFPDSAAGKVNLAKTLILTGKTSEGEALLRDVLAKAPADMLALTTELQWRLQNGQFAPAIAAVEKARAAAPADPLLAAMHADLLIRSGEPARAIAMLEGRRATFPMTAVLTGALARAQRAAGQQDRAVATYGVQLAASPTDAEARPAQVDLLLRAGKLDEARASLREGLAQAPGTYGLLSALVTLETRTGGLDAALRLAAELRRDPAQMPAATLLQGDVLMRAKQYVQAARAWQFEFAATPLPALASRIANAYVAAGQEDDAAGVLRAWLRDHPGDPDAAQDLSRLDLKANRMDDAAKNLELVLAARPDDATTLNNLAWIYQSRNDPRARDMAQRAYLRSPTPRIADTLGWILVQRGDARAAVNVLEPAWRQAQSDPALTYHLAAAYRDDGRPDWALQLLQPLLTNPAAFPDRAAATRLRDELAK